MVTSRRDQGTTSRIRSFVRRQITNTQKWDLKLRVTESEVRDQPPLSSEDETISPAKAPTAFIATRLAALLRNADTSLCYVALSESSADLQIPMKPPLCSEMIAPPDSGMISPP
ncbi:hypothetical protein ASE04_29545 [Rhizobium sp. Root708]|nr:hypothetical protein ASE04_29545 [Rhizobium sp. Root708]